MCKIVISIHIAPSSLSNFESERKGARKEDSRAGCRLRPSIEDLVSLASIWWTKLEASFEADLASVQGITAREKSAHF